MSRDLKLALYFPTLAMGGVERMALNLAQVLYAKGLSIDLVVVSANGPLRTEIPKGIRLFDLKSRKTSLSVFKLASYLKRERPDIILSSMSHANIFAITAAMIANIELKIVISEHSMPFKAGHKKKSSLKDVLIQLMCRLLYKRANGLVCVSDSVRKSWQGLLGATYPLATHVIYNPVIAADFYKRASHLPKDFSPEENNMPTIVSVGRLNPVKDFPTLIKAFALLNKKINTRLIILGEGKERKKLEQLISEKKLESKVSLLGVKNNVLPYLTHADIFVSTSRSEGLPSALIEAIALGTSVVVSDCPGGSTEIIEQGKYGHIFPVGDYSSLADKLFYVLENPTDKMFLKERAKVFYADTVAEEYLKLFQTL